MPSRLSGLQGLRGIAASFVFLFHLVPASGLGSHVPALGSVARWGFSGVDVFFVLSGFVMWHTTHQASGPAAARRFLLSRLARIFSGYWPMLAITVAIFALLSPQTLRDANILGSVFLLEPRDSRLIITVAWSLVFELYFYVLFACLLCMRRRHQLAVVGVGMLILLVVNTGLLICCEPGLSGGTTEGYFFLSPFVAEFFAGCLIAAAYHAGFAGCDYRLIAALGVALACFGIGFGVADGELPTHQIARVSSFGLAASGIVLTFVALERYFLWPRWLVALGDQSYALYLGHPVLLSVAALSGVFAVAGNNTGFLLGMAALFVLGTQILVKLYYIHIELPAYRLAKNKMINLLL